MALVGELDSSGSRHGFWRAVLDIYVRYDSIKCGQFTDQVSDCNLLKKDSTDIMFL